MDLSPFESAFNLVMSHSYLFIFVAMVIEGPVVTAASAFAAALGYMNFPLVFLLSFLGDMTGDLIYYSLGFWGRKRFVNRYGHYFGLTEIRLAKVTHLLKTHPIKTLVASKYIPFISASGLIAAGLAHLSPRRFLIIDILITLPSTIFFSSAGFYFGLAFDRLFQSLKNVQYAMLIVIVLAILLAYLYRQIFELLYKDWKKEIEATNNNHQE